jgi:Ser/Thr protein kinase RdoA (MazF antagonist)
MNESPADLERAAAILPVWLDGQAQQVSPLSGGLINHTYLIEGRTGRSVLQRLNPIFSGELHHDIEAVTAHLQHKGLPTPRLLRTQGGQLYTTDAEGAVWRLQTFMAGRTFDRVERPAHAAEAGALVGRFHGALRDLDHTFRFQRLNVHDTPRHLQTLKESVATKTDHPRHAEVRALADEIFAALAALPPIDDPALPRRIVHGDLKISNVVFDGDAARCLVDLDTLAYMTIPVELGDAWRSWCNPLGEDVTEAEFDLELLRAAWGGYGAVAGSWLQPVERTRLVAGVLTISAELSARFLADVLRDCYFGWDPARFASRSEHNLVRAKGQLSLHRSLARRRHEAERVIAA